LRILHKASQSLSIIGKTFRQAWPNHKDYLLLLPVILIFEVLAPFPMLLFPKRIIDSLIEERSLSGALFNGVLLAGSMLLLDGVLAFLRSRRSLAMERMKQGFLRDMDGKIMSVPYEKLEESSFMEQLHRAKAAVNGESTWAVTLMKGDKGLDAIGAELTNILAGIIKIAGVVYILAELDSVIIFFIGIVVAVSAGAGSVKKRADYARRVRTSVLGDQSQYYRKTMLNPANGKDIRLNVMQPYLLEKSAGLRNRFIDARFKKISTNIAADSVRVVLNVLQEFVVYVYLILQVIRRGMTIGSFTLYASTIQSLSQFIMQLIDSVLNLSLFADYLSDYFAIMETPEAQPEQSAALLEAREGPHEIEFRDVWFRYPGAEQYTLKGISIVIRPGEKLSVVGANGAGKTSFIKLLLRFYRPQRGEIYLDKVEIGRYRMDSYLKALSAVFQDYGIYDFTVGENVAMAEEADASSLWGALEKARISQRIQSLPQKLETPMSRHFSAEGVELSQGQQQKLAIARAFYKDAGVIVLDEPTAALDPIAECELYEDLNSLIKEKTAVFISHRMSSSRFCDHIAVFDKGEIVEYGSHEELMGRQGLYYRMFSEQAKYYSQSGAKGEVL